MSRTALAKLATLLVTLPNNVASLPIPSKLKFITPNVSPNALLKAGPNNSARPPPNTINPSVAFIIADIVSEPVFKNPSASISRASATS